MKGHRNAMIFAGVQAEFCNGYLCHLINLVVSADINEWWRKRIHQKWFNMKRLWSDCFTEVICYSQSAIILFIVIYAVKGSSCVQIKILKKHNKMPWLHTLASTIFFMVMMSIQAWIWQDNYLNHNAVWEYKLYMPQLQWSFITFVANGTGRECHSSRP